MDDKKLVNACVEGDQTAQKYLYDKYKTYLFGVCLRYAKSKMEGEDMLQEGFVRIFKDLASWSGNGPLRAWMRKVMVNSALMHIRKYKKLKFTDVTDNEMINAQFVELDFSEMGFASGVIKMIQQLPEPYQTVFNLKAIDGYAFKEISMQLQTKESTLRSHYARARKKLKEILERELLK